MQPATRTPHPHPPGLELVATHLLQSVSELLLQAGVQGGNLLRPEWNGSALTWYWEGNGSRRMCPVAVSWRPARPFHVSNNAYVRCSGDGLVTLRCLHNTCTLSREAGLQPLGAIPSPALAQLTSWLAGLPRSPKRISSTASVGRGAPADAQWDDLLDKHGSKTLSEASDADVISYLQFRQPSLLLPDFFWPGWANVVVRPLSSPANGGKARTHIRVEFSNSVHADGRRWAPVDLPISPVLPASKADCSLRNVLLLQGLAHMKLNDVPWLTPEQIVSLGPAVRPASPAQRRNTAPQRGSVCAPRPNPNAASMDAPHLPEAVPTAAVPADPRAPLLISSTTDDELAAYVVLNGLTLAFPPLFASFGLGGTCSDLFCPACAATADGCQCGVRPPGAPYCVLLRPRPGPGAMALDPPSDLLCVPVSVPAGSPTPSIRALLSYSFPGATVLVAAPLPGGPRKRSATHLSDYDPRLPPARTARAQRGPASYAPTASDGATHASAQASSESFRPISPVPVPGPDEHCETGPAHIAAARNSRTAGTLAGRPAPRGRLLTALHRQQRQVVSSDPLTQRAPPPHLDTPGPTRPPDPADLHPPAASPRPDVPPPMEAWLSASNPFDIPPPAEAVSAVNEWATSDQADAGSQTGRLDGWEIYSDGAWDHRTPAQTTSQRASQDDDPSPIWVLPDEEWYAAPPCRRPEIGSDLLDKGMAIWCPPDPTEPPPQQHPDPAPSPDQWESPLQLGSWNVGLRGLTESMGYVYSRMVAHPLDVLFLTDLRLSRAKVGKVRSRLEQMLDGQWRFLSNISEPVAANKRPVGVGALVHASLSQFLEVIPAPAPPDLPLDAWLSATAGRILILRGKRPEASGVCWLVGVYQHVAMPWTRADRHALLVTLAAISTRAAEEGAAVVFLGDMNSAPQGGRWGYSASTHVAAVDEEVTEWLRQRSLSESLSCPLEPTWASPWADQRTPRRAVLDRVWFHPANLGLSSVSVFWPEAVDLDHFDHALIHVRLPKHVIGPSYANWSEATALRRGMPDFRVDRKKLMSQRAAWQSLVTEQLRQSESHLVSMPPAHRLQATTAIQHSAALMVAGRDVNRRGVTKPFMFAGHRALSREAAQLSAARKLVLTAAYHPAELAPGTPRSRQWPLSVTGLSRALRRSQFLCPPPLPQPLEHYLRDDQRELLIQWATSAKQAVQARRQDIAREVEQALQSNLTRLRARIVRSPADLSSDLVQEALGKPRSHQAMWGILTSLPSGLQITPGDGRVDDSVRHLRSLKAASSVQRVGIQPTRVQVWFASTRPLGDLLEELHSRPLPAAHLSLLRPPNPTMLTADEDKLAAQELHLAAEGLDHNAVCEDPGCASRDVSPIVCSGPPGGPGGPRVIRYWCGTCCTLRCATGLAPPPPCPIPVSEWLEGNRIPEDHPPCLARPIDMTMLDEYLDRLPLGRQPGVDACPYEYFKYGPPEVRQVLLAVLNDALRTGSIPDEWKGGCIRFLAKRFPALRMTDWRPVCLLPTAMKILSIILNDRLSRILEEYGILEPEQEGARKERNVQRAVFYLQSLVNDARQRRQQQVVLWLDFSNAFNSVSHRVLFDILAAYGLPAQDVNLLRKLYEGLWYTVSNSFGTSAVCPLQRGVKQGDVTSPVLFNLVINILLRYLKSTERGYVVSTGRRSTCGAFLDDTVLTTSSTASMQLLATALERFCQWSGLNVNVEKSVISGINHATGARIVTDGVKFQGRTFAPLPPDRLFRFLGVRVTLTGDPAHEKQHVLAVMRDLLTNIAKCRVLSPPLRETVLQIGVTSMFRFSAALTTWSWRELEEITRLWVQGFKSAWKLPRSSDDTPLRVRSEEGGRAAPDATTIWLEAVDTLFNQCCTFDDHVTESLHHQVRDACRRRGCLGVQQLQTVLAAAPGEARSLVDLFLCRLSERRMVAKLAASDLPADPARTTILDALWPKLYPALLRHREVAGIDVCETDQRLERAKRCLAALGFLGPRDVLYVDQLLAGGGRDTEWLRWISMAHTRVPRHDYQALLQFLPALAPDRQPAGLGRSGQQSLVTSWGPRAPTAASDTPSGHSGTAPAEGAPCPLITPAADSPSQDSLFRLRGRVTACVEFDQIQLECGEAPHLLVASLSDEALGLELCRYRAVLRIPEEWGLPHGARPMTCVAPGDALTGLVRDEARPPFLVAASGVTPAHADPWRLTTIPISGPKSVRSLLLDQHALTLAGACLRPPWLVPRRILERWFEVPVLPVGLGPGLRRSRWELTWPDDRNCASDGQATLSQMVSGVHAHRRSTGGQATPSREAPALQPWQLSPGLPDRVQVDLSNHLPRIVFQDPVWEVLARNGTATISSADGRHHGLLELAQYMMLKELSADNPLHDQDDSTLFHQCVLAACRSQSRADAQGQVSWSRHLLAFLRTQLDLTTVVGQRSVCYNPAFPHYVSPDPMDQLLGGSQRPHGRALLLLDGFDGTAREAVLAELATRSSTRSQESWVLTLTEDSVAAQEGISLLRRFGARPWMRIPKHLDVWHSRGCWAEGDYEPVRSSSGAQLWILGECSSCPPQDPIRLALSSPDRPPAWAEAFFTLPAGPAMLSH